MKKIYPASPVFVFVLTFICCFFLENPAFAAHPWHVNEQDFRHSIHANQAARKNRWSDMRAHAARIKDPLIPKLFKWIQLTKADDPSVSAKELMAFIRKNPTWPGQEKLHKRVEYQMGRDVPADKVIDWFKDPKTGDFKTPFTAKGKMYLAEAIIKTNTKPDDSDLVTNLLRESWIDTDFSSSEERAFLAEHKNVIRQEDTEERISRLIWDRRFKDANRILSKASSDKQKLFIARMKLKNNEYGMDQALANVPSKLRNEEGLVYDRMVWREKYVDGKNIEELAERLPKNQQYADRWWGLKESVIRDLLAKKKPALAYKVAANHGLKVRTNLIEAEWLAGWIAMQYLDNPKDAYKHFHNLYENVYTPISLGRACYWAARASEETKNYDIAEKWYREGSKYPSSFYGQLATEALKMAEYDLPPKVSISKQDVIRYQKNDLVHAAYVLHSLDRHGDARSFLEAAVRHADTEGERFLVTKFGQDIGRKDYSLSAAKEVSKIGKLYVETHYNVIDSIRKKKKPEAALVHGIIMQESIFDTNAVSSAGARGLMQLMPRTAQEVARKNNYSYSKARLTSDPAYNITLGSHYLASLVDNYRGSYILATAAYNGGQGNVNKWIKKYGDPRNLKSVHHIVDWIETIPFKETRNYVQRVMENTQMYRYVLNPERGPKVELKEDLFRG